MAKFLPSDLFPLMVEHLAQYGELHGPVLTEQDVIAFGPIDSIDHLLFDYQRTLLPPKKYLLPPRQTTFSWDPALGYQLVPESDRKPIVLFGLHPCDLAGIAYLDRVFLSDPHDQHYEANRARLILVGLSCEPDSYCFCSAFGVAGAGYDLFMQRAGVDFIISHGTPRGAQILQTLTLGEHCESPSFSIPTLAEEERIREAVSRGETFPNSLLWEEFANSCLSCGACSLCCPTCYCFDVRETADLAGKGASRLREWDNCLFRSHGEIAGGVNFRPSRLDRFHYRYQHKYLGFGPTRGIVSCVGCGRCREVCPVKIDLLALFEQ